MRTLGRALALVLLSALYALAILISALLRFVQVRNRSHRPILVNGTFHNPNWFHAHITPLTLASDGKVILVCDASIAPLANMEYAIPPPMLQQLLTRAGSKALWTLYHGIRQRPSHIIGYHVFPSALTVLICARLVGAKAIYQMTAGELELQGGGWNAENRVMRALDYESPWLEWLAARLADQFDHIVVRGSRAETWLRSHGVNVPVTRITGSIEIPPLSENHDKDIDLIFVGRLTEYKRPDLFVEMVASLAQHVKVNAVVVGDGPDQLSLEKQASELGISESITFLGQRGDVPLLLARAKVIVLTSRWEGVSIAMLEAMAAQAVPVVFAVGDLGDFIEQSRTGFCHPFGDVEGLMQSTRSLLQDDKLRQTIANQARQLVADRSSRPVITDRWKRLLA